MKRSLIVRLALPALLILPVGYRASGWLLHKAPKPTFSSGDALAGRDLFVHEWTPNDPLAVGGDGLGPMFNANSCVACHQQGGLGGSGSLANNVTAFTVVPVTLKDGTPGSKRDAKAGVVHSFATADGFLETLDEVSPQLPSINRPKLADLLPAVQQNCVVAPRIGTAPGVNISHRNTPALFGANLIDSIPDRVIIANERKQRVAWGLADSDTDDYPVGRALRLANGHVGKFGWKAQIGTLGDFVRAACANELGLGNPTNAQPASLRKRDYRAPGLDLTEQQCAQITAFCASLPRPVEAVPDDSALAQMIAEGIKAFHAVGCADCHMPDLGEVKGLYSDLLLHRMGRGLVGGGSYGDPPAELPEFPQGSGPEPSEWRTPPLWGVANSAPYLHDGRAATLTDAIHLHQGQAARSALKFGQLPSEKQRAILEFLKSLQAPRAEPVPDTALAARDSADGQTIVPAERH